MNVILFQGLDDDGGHVFHGQRDQQRGPRLQHLHAAPHDIQSCECLYIGYRVYCESLNMVKGKFCK